MALSEIFAPIQIEYPSSDGEPIAESDFQRKPLIYAIEALSAYFQNEPDVYVSGDLFIYYEEGNPQARVAPDVFVVFGVSKADRPSYFVWKEGQKPDFVLEITSRSTVSVDQGAKRGIYAYLGVTEYFQFYPTGDYLRPSLIGLRLSGENYVPIQSRQSDDGALIVPSEVLELELRLDDSGLRFYDPASGKKLLNYQEVEAARQEEQAARLEAEARIAELEAELARLKK